MGQDPSPHGGRIPSTGIGVGSSKSIQIADTSDAEPFFGPRWYTKVLVKEDEAPPALRTYPLLWLEVPRDPEGSDRQLRDLESLSTVAFSLLPPVPQHNGHGQGEA